MNTISGWGLAETPHGKAYVAWQDRALCLLEFADCTACPAFEPTLRDDSQASQWSQQAFSPAAKRIKVTFLQGTPFQRRVWQALQGIPIGSTMTYQELAQSIGVPTAARAVGSAVGANGIAVVVPCHRVIRSDGGLGGYKWGLARKLALLESEGLKPRRA